MDTPPGDLSTPECPAVGYSRWYADGLRWVITEELNMLCLSAACWYAEGLHWEVIGQFDLSHLLFIFVAGMPGDRIGNY